MIRSSENINELDSLCLLGLKIQNVNNNRDKYTKVCVCVCSCTRTGIHMSSQHVGSCFKHVIYEFFMWMILLEKVIVRSSC